MATVPHRTLEWIWRVLTSVGCFPVSKPSRYSVLNRNATESTRPATGIPRPPTNIQRHRTSPRSISAFRAPNRCVQYATPDPPSPWQLHALFFSANPAKLTRIYSQPTKPAPQPSSSSSRARSPSRSAAQHTSSHSRYGSRSPTRATRRWCTSPRQKA